MLGLIEQVLLGRLQADPVLQRAPRPVLVAGAAQPPKTGSVASLAVWARALRTAGTDLGADDPAPREPARAVRRLTLQPDRQQDSAGRVFALPANGFDDRTDQLAELTANGRQLRAGVDYLMDGRTIRCLRAPGGSLGVRILGLPARGYVERCAVELELALLAWGPSDGSWDQQVAAGDALLTHGVAVALAAVEDRHALDLAIDGEAGFELRLLRPRTRLASVARAAPPGSAPFAEAVIPLRGELELTLAHGLPEPEGGMIRQVMMDPNARVTVRETP